MKQVNSTYVSGIPHEQICTLHGWKPKFRLFIKNIFPKNLCCTGSILWRSITNFKISETWRQQVVGWKGMSDINLTRSNQKTVQEQFFLFCSVLFVLLWYKQVWWGMNSTSKIYADVLYFYYNWHCTIPLKMHLYFDWYRALMHTLAFQWCLSFQRRWISTYHRWGWMVLFLSSVADVKFELTTQLIHLDTMLYQFLRSHLWRIPAMKHHSLYNKATLN